MKKCSKKQKNIEYEMMKKWDFKDEKSIKKGLNNLNNIHVLNRLFYEYKKLTNIRMFKNIKEETLGLSVIMCFYTLSTIAVLIYGNTFLKLWFAVPLSIIMFYIPFYLTNEYYKKGKETLLTSISDNNKDKELIFGILKSLPFYVEKELIKEKIKTESEEDSMILNKKKRL